MAPQGAIFVCYYPFMEIEEPQVCPWCKNSMDSWHWVRFRGLGIWKDKNQYHSCPNCKKRFDGTDVPKVDIGKIEFISTDRQMKAHIKHIHSRVIDDGGNSLSGRKGLEYMEKNANKSPGYVNRLKEYYK